MKRVWKIVSGVVVVFIALLVSFLYWTTWTGSAEEIESVAGQLKANPEWREISNQVIPPKTICLDEKCPSVHRSWETNEKLSKDDFQRLLEDSSWELIVRGDCETSLHTSGAVPVCSAEGVVDDYSVSVTIWADDKHTEGRIILIVSGQ